MNVWSAGYLKLGLTILVNRFFEGGLIVEFSIETVIIFDSLRYVAGRNHALGHITFPRLIKGFGYRSAITAVGDHHETNIRLSESSFPDKHTQFFIHQIETAGQPGYRCKLSID